MKYVMSEVLINLIEKHHSKAEKFNSVVKGVPVSKENLELMRCFAQGLCGCSRSDIRVMYRGPRTGSANVTLRKDAVAFDVYHTPRYKVGYGN